jgi:hypothetical protein
MQDRGCNLIYPIYTKKDIIYNGQCLISAYIVIRIDVLTPKLIKPPPYDRQIFQSETPLRCRFGL